MGNYVRVTAKKGPLWGTIADPEPPRWAATRRPLTAMLIGIGFYVSAVGIIAASMFVSSMSWLPLYAGILILIGGAYFSGSSMIHAQSFDQRIKNIQR